MYIIKNLTKNKNKQNNIIKNKKECDELKNTKNNLLKSNKSINSEIYSEICEIFVIDDFQGFKEEFGEILKDKSTYCLSKENGISFSIAHRLKSDKEYKPRIDTLLKVVQSTGYKIALVGKYD
ncbi:hypothetical protein J2127_001312 [Methanococcus voltae]|uniref:hypothetical protein n=1 Tax=Methanococcus voltae TaxID=2188 RepID=UPI001AE6590F|nr:hypothetical protein [Methanococcus voltae]MBP2144142.1 hypothetical protein [Methanococcus voltae]